MWLKILALAIGFIDEHFRSGMRSEFSMLGKTVIIGLVVSAIFVVLAIAAVPVMLLASHWR